MGSIGAGKTTFRQQLMEQDIDYAKTQSIEAFDGVIDTPGEYLEYGRLRRALQVVAYDVDTVVMMLDPTSDGNRIPPGFAISFNKPTIGIVTKIDLASPTQIAAAEEQLAQAGAERIYAVDSLSGRGFDDVREALCRT
ncbi:EutP/PduV family microcompartment system protein [Tessaracoccus massiliensis]|uniref:EutP/PduV family microcompartment system protein n=1 Tax=Tessaracoccus massiliensis TaxID=1522311 RepID=UPI001FE70035|nr:EutP/PduV family microcompartment system protein [Tessaracoccus massiliensis]